MPEPYDSPDPGPLDDLQRETERIVRALGERAQARTQRNLAQQATAERTAGERAERDAGRRRDAGEVTPSGDAEAPGGHRDQQPATNRTQSETDQQPSGPLESGPLESGQLESGRSPSGRHQAERADDRAQQGYVAADRHDRLADRLQAHGVEPGLASTRVRADRSFGAPPTKISRRPSMAARSQTGTHRARTRGARTGPPRRRSADRGSR